MSKTFVNWYYLIKHNINHGLTNSLTSGIIVMLVG